MPDLRDRILDLLARVGDSAEMSAVLTELEETYDRLWAAAEEIRVQGLEIERLRHTQQLMRWQQQRVQALLPAAIVTTDADGVVAAANAAAVLLLGADMVQLVRTDLFGFVSTEERSELRAAAAELSPGDRLRRAVTIVGPDGRRVPVELSAATGAPEAPEISWVLVPLSSSTARDDEQVGVSEALVDLGALPASPLEDLELLQRAASLCQTALGDVALSISVGAPTAPTRVASTSTTAQAIDGVQLPQEAGPSVLAFAGAQTVTSPDLRADARWPFLAADERVPAVGAVAVPLAVGGQRLGVLSVYAEGRVLSDRFVRSVEMLGAAVAAVLHEAVVRRELERESSELEAALESRATIDQAKGIVMAERGCSAQEAFDHLVELSSTQHVKLREVARMLVELRSIGPSQNG